MIDKEISSHVLTIGTDYRPCNGGISVLLNGYSTFFEEFNFIKSSGKGCKVLKLFYFVQSMFLLLYYCLFCSKIRIVHIHTATFSFLKREKWYVYIAHYFGKKVVVHLHGGAFESVCKESSNQLSKVFQDVDYVVCVSKYLANIVSRYKLHNKITVIPNFIEKPQYRSGLKKNNPLLLSFLGTIVKDKGIFDIIDVIGVNQSYFRGKIVLKIGGKGNVGQMQQLIDKYGIQDIVQYLGFVAKAEKAKLLTETSIYVQPSYVESFGISILEAMSYGCAVISSNVGGIPEVLDSSDGFLVSPGDKQDLFDKMVVLIENDKLRKTFVKNAIAKSCQFYINEVEKMLNSFYLSL